MSDITLSNAVRGNLLSLQNTAEMMSRTQERLSSGKKVISALDNPSSYFTAQGLDNRASDISKLLDSVSNGVQVLKAADAGIMGIQKLVDSAKSTARQALQAPNAYTTKASLTSGSKGLSATDLTGIIAGTGVNASSGTGTTAIAPMTNVASTSPTSGAGNVVAIGADTAATKLYNSMGSTGAGVVGATALNALAPLGGTNFADGDTLSINGQTLTFKTSGASGANEININDTVTNLAGKLQGLLRDATNGSGTTSTVSFDDTTHKLTVTASDNTKDITIGGSAVAKAGLVAETLKPTNTSAIPSSGSMTFQVGTNQATTVYFGTGTGQISNRRDLLTQLNTVSGLSATVDPGNGGQILLKNANASDYKSSIVLTASTGGTLTGFGALTADSGSTTVKTYAPTNLLSQNTALKGQSLTIGVGTNSKTFTFGSATGQISTYEELTDAVSQAGGILTRDAGNKLSIRTADANVAQPLTISGNAASTLGINAGQFAGTGQSLAGKSLNVTIGTGADQKVSNIVFGTAAGQVKTLDDLNTKLAGDGVGVQASLDNDGKLSLTASNDAARKTFSINGTAAVQAFGAASAFTAVQSSAPSFGGAGDTQRRNLVKDFNDLLGQMDKLAQDSSYNGVNLLNGDDLSLVFNENGTSKLNIKGVSFDSKSLGVDTLTADGSDFLDSGSINNVLNKLDTASNTLRSQSSKFGSNLSIVQTRQDFSKNLINVLQTGSANLTLADLNEEGANYSALSTRSQISTSALALSAQAGQQVLQLLR